MECLPTLEQLENSIKVENNFTDHQKVAKELEPLIKFIDFNQIKAQILADIIEPLKIISVEIIVGIYRNKALSNNLDSNGIRGTSQRTCKLNESDHVWDESACGTKLIIEDNGKVVHAPNDCYIHQNVRAKMVLENKGIFEWDVIIEKACAYSWVGVCASENVDYESFVGYQPTGWVLSSHGNCWNSNKGLKYCPEFRDDTKITKITVHLDMNKRTCAFSVNGIKYREISEWNNLPSKLYPVVSLKHPGRFRIQLHQKN